MDRKKNRELHEILHDIYSTVNAVYELGCWGKSSEDPEYQDLVVDDIKQGDFSNLAAGLTAQLNKVNMDLKQIIQKARREGAEEAWGLAVKAVKGLDPESEGIKSPMVMWTYCVDGLTEAKDKHLKEKMIIQSLYEKGND